MRLRTPSLSRLIAGAACPLLLAGVWTGCVSEPKSGHPAALRGAEGGLDEINLLAVPFALNFDQTPGPDGFALKVYASSAAHPKPVPLPNGKLEVFMFDSTPGLDGSGLGEPKRVWTFTASELKPVQIESSIGVGYELALSWGKAKPTGNRITLIARYTPARGRPITSAPSIVSVGVR